MSFQPSFFSEQKKTNSFFQRWAKHPPAWAIVLLIFLIGIFVRSPALTFNGFFDPDAHFHARLSAEVASFHTIPAWDALSMQGRAYSYPPVLHVVVGMLSAFLDITAMDALKLFGILIGALLGVTVFLFARELTQSRPIAYWSALFATLSGIAIIRTSGFTRPDGVALTLIPFILYLWLTHREKSALLFCVLMVFLHPLSAVFLGICLGIWVVAGLLKLVRLPLLLPIAMGAMVLSFFVWMYWIGFSIGDYASPVSLEATELAKFALLSFILYFPLSWAFSVMGILRGRLPVLLVGWIALTILLGAVGTRLVMYMIPFLAVAGGYGLFWAVEKIYSVRRAFPVLLTLLLVLSTFTAWHFMSGISPYVSNAQLSGLSFLKNNSGEHDSVLSIWDQGHVIAYYTNRPVVIDGYFEFAPDDLEKRNDTSKEALYTSHCSAWENSMDAFHASFFFLSPDELSGTGPTHGVLELEPCPGARTLYSSDGARVMERVVTIG